MWRANYISQLSWFVDFNLVLLQCQDPILSNDTVKRGKMECWGNLEFPKYFFKKKKDEICNSVGTFITYIFLYCLPMYSSRDSKSKLPHFRTQNSISALIPFYPRWGKMENLCVFFLNFKTCLLHYNFLATGQNRNYRG